MSEGAVELIEGVKIDVKSDEMKDVLAKRAEYHKTRASWYESQLKSLREAQGAIAAKIVEDAGDEEDEEMAANLSNAYGKGSNFRGDSPIDQLASKVKAHRARQAYFRFMSEHVIPGKTYRLKEDDLTRLELLSQYM
jgi:hypothetical protein